MRTLLSKSRPQSGSGFFYIVRDMGPVKGAQLIFGRHHEPQIVPGSGTETQMKESGRKNENS